jgi:hypothetical protein
MVEASIKLIVYLKNDRMITRSILFSAALLVCLSTFSQIRIYSNEFLNIGAGARCLGM